MRMMLIGTAAIAAVTFAACGAGKTENKADNKASEVPAAAVDTAKKVETGMRDIGNRVEVMTAIQHNDRPAKDKEDDAARKPADVLKLSGVWPGQTVVELEAGGGYYTELLSRIVGPSGKVLMQNPKAFDAFLSKEVMDARLGADGRRLSNVILSKTNFDAIEMRDGSADLVTWILGPHEIYYTPEGGSSMGTSDTSYAEIFRILKPGGKFLALDHAAAAGSPETTGNTTHRIDPAIVRAAAEKAGLVYTSSSEALANKDDDYNLGVFDPKVRRKTDRFIHLYTKPK